jgi:hypothetical protein
MSLLLGVNAFAASGAGGRRQAQALASWRGLRDAGLANLQWPDAVYEVEGFITQPLLRQDARTVSGQRGRRLPVLNEAFDRLCELAAGQGHDYFGYANSDIALTQAVVERVLAGGREAYAISRMEVDPESGEELGMVTAGIDLFVIAVPWWRANRGRFRAYLGGEAIWDNVYTAILLSHADALLLNREPLILHQRHPAGDWSGSPYAHYLHYLAALDSPYFSRWARYHYRLEGLRARGAGAEEELALQRECFRGGIPLSERVAQLGRGTRARLRWARMRGRAG